MAPFVMVIDDSPVIRKILDICLLRAGYDTRSFPDGVEALCWLNTTEARVPDLVIVDLELPRLDGYQVIQQIKARPALECTRLVILSQRDDLLDRLKGQLVGAHAYLTMPFKTDRLLAVIRASLEAAVPSTEEARKQEKYKIVSSETTAHTHVSMGVFLPGQDGLLVNIANREQDRRRMEPLYGHNEEAQ